jgi:hypothetical protein
VLVEVEMYWCVDMCRCVGTRVDASSVDVFLFLLPNLTHTCGLLLGLGDQ